MLSVEKPGSPSEILEHSGVKGMKWGVRKAVDKSIGTKTAGRRPGRKSSSTGSKLKTVGRALGRLADDVTFEFGTQSSQIQGQIAGKASERLVKSLPRIKARHGEYGKLRNRAKKPFSKEAKAYRADVKKAYLRHLETSANEITNIRGTRQYTLKEKGKPNTSSYFWEVKTQPIKHADDNSFVVRPIFDDEGWIVDLELVEESMAQMISLGHNFLIHSGIIE